MVDHINPALPINKEYTIIPILWGPLGNAGFISSTVLDRFVGSRHLLRCVAASCEGLTILGPRFCYGFSRQPGVFDYCKSLNPYSNPQKEVNYGPQPIRGSYSTYFRGPGKP